MTDFIVSFASPSSILPQDSKPSGTKMLMEDLQELRIFGVLCTDRYWLGNAEKRGIKGLVAATGMLWWQEASARGFQGRGQNSLRLTIASWYASWPVASRVACIIGRPEKGDIMLLWGSSKKFF